MKPNRLYALFFEVTKQCNAHCDHCGSSCDIKTKEAIDIKWFKKALDEVASVYNPETVFVYITGGEPLMRKDLFDLTSYISSKGFQWGLVTNGMLLNKEKIKKCKETGMSTMSISIDGMKETHENFRHVKGSFDKIVENIKLLHEESFVEHLQITFTATKQNLYELPELYRFLSMLPINSLRISNIDLIGRAKENQALMLDKNDYEFLFRFIEKHKDDKLPVVWSCTHYFGDDGENPDPTKKIFKCHTGINVGSVLADGTIYGCPNIPRRKELVQGNIITDNFMDVWKNKFIPFRNKEILKSNNCKNCEYWKNCQGDSFHSFDFENQRQGYCYKEMFQENNSPEILSEIPEFKISEHYLEVKPKSKNYTRKLLFTPEATQELFEIFKFGRTHPINMYEQQAAFIGYQKENEFHVHYVIPSLLLNRSGNYAISNNFCLEHVLDEVDIINENLLKLDRTVFPVKLLGFAHSHPIDTEFRFSISDVENEQFYAEKFGKDFLAILINPQKEKIVCFSSKDLTQEFLRLYL